jgi:hypothetical protein
MEEQNLLRQFLMLAQGRGKWLASRLSRLNLGKEPLVSTEWESILAQTSPDALEIKNISCPLQ